jgi:hypothetical protein
VELMRLQEDMCQLGRMQFIAGKASSLWGFTLLCVDPVGPFSRPSKGIIFYYYFLKAKVDS